MTWGRIDDGFETHPKRRLVDVACDGVLMRAVSRSAKNETDGYVEASWVHDQLRPRRAQARQRVIDAMVEHRLLEPLAAGEERAISAPARRGIRLEGRTVTVGPFAQDGYLIHDFLHYHPAREDLEERRLQERSKKADQRAKSRQDLLPWDLASQGVPKGQPPVSPEVSLNQGHRVGVGEDIEPSHGESNDARARELLATVRRVVGILATCRRFHVDEVGVQNALQAFPNGDHERAAREAVVKGGDPTWRVTNAARALWIALEDQARPAPHAARAGARRTGGMEAGMRQAQMFARMAEEAGA